MSINLKELTCLNCGGSINRNTLICEYCRTQYYMNGSFPTIDSTPKDEKIFETPLPENFSMESSEENISYDMNEYVRLITENNQYDDSDQNSSDIDSFIVFGLAIFFAVISYFVLQWSIELLYFK